MEKWERVTGYRCSAYQCGYVEFNDALPERCPNCDAEMMMLCPKCGGSGEYVMMTHLVCPICDGKGWIPAQDDY